MREPVASPTFKVCAVSALKCPPICPVSLRACARARESSSLIKGRELVSLHELRTGWGSSFAFGELVKPFSHHFMGYDAPCPDIGFSFRIKRSFMRRVGLHIENRFSFVSSSHNFLPTQGIVA